MIKEWDIARLWMQRQGDDQDPPGGDGGSDPDHPDDPNAAGNPQ
ncbi:hypothetical protein [Rhodothermus profundi]|nr:hypothetical protein [Rhodothermus profundi]